MRRLAILLVLLALPAMGWGATYYVDCGAGSDTNGGTHPSTDAWATMGKAWETLTTGTHTIEVTTGNCYAEDNALGGAAPSETLTFLSSGGTVNARIMDATVTAVFQAAAGQTGTNIFSGNFVFDQGTHGDSSAVTLKYFFNAGSVNGITYELRDVELHGSGATSGKPFNANSGVTSTVFKALRSNLHDFNASWDDDGQLYLEACFIENWYRLYPDGSANITLINNTWDSAGSANNRIRVTGAGGTTAAITIQNNLFYSSIAAGTGWIPLEVQSSGYTNLVISNNVGWKTGAATYTDVNSWPYIYAPSAAVPNSLMSFDPDFSTAPAINATSMLIGLGAATGVLTSYNGETITTPTIGCYFPSGASSPAYNATANEVLLVGDSWCDTDLTTGTEMGRYLSDALSGYTFVEMPARSNTAPCISGAKLERLVGIMTDLIVQERPDIVVFHGGVNDHGQYNQTVLPDQVDAFFDVCSALGPTTCIYGGAQPDDGVPPVVTAVAETIEAGVAGCDGAGAVCANLTARWIAADDWGTYYAADPLHPSTDGYVDYGTYLGTLVIADYESGKSGRVLGGGLYPGHFGSAGSGSGAASLASSVLAWAGVALEWGGTALEWSTD